MAFRNQNPNLQIPYPAGQQPQQQRGNPNMNAPPPPNMGNNAQNNRPANLSVPGQNQHPQHQPMQQLPNAMGAPMPMPNIHPGMGPMPLKGVPQQSQMGMQGMPMPPGHRLPAPNATPDLSLVMQAQRISQQQRAAVQMQQHQGGGGQQTMHSSPPNAIRGLPNMGGGGGGPNPNQPPFMPQAGMSPNPMQQQQQQQQQQHFANSSPNPNSNVNSPATLANSPRLNPQYAQLEASYRAKFPTATQEQVRKMVADAPVSYTHLTLPTICSV